MQPMLAPGSWLGLMGGGQLGRMFAMAAQSLGYRVLVLDPDPNSPASAVCDEQIVAAYDDVRALAALAERVHAITTEFENVPAQSLAQLAEHRLVTPASESVAIAQDRIAEKGFIASAGAKVAPHHVIGALSDFDTAAASLYPGVLKASRLGYDGKGQARVANASEARAAFIELKEVPCVLEQRLDLDFEISVVMARAMDGSMAFYPIAENLHRDGILQVSRVPSPRVGTELARAALAEAKLIANALDYHGILCVEFFVLKDGSLIVNEMAPRPHNSGHYTIDACITSQFEAQVRVMCGAPLGSTDLHSSSVMLNIMGDLWFSSGSREALEPDWAAVLAHPKAKLHLYGKRTPRPARKMGHITLLGDGPLEALFEEARSLAAALGMPEF
jgi:5-(carboxyamino)imidazole ribonucleotide synthase